MSEKGYKKKFKKLYIIINKFSGTKDLSCTRSISKMINYYQTNTKYKSTQRSIECYKY